MSFSIEQINGRDEVVAIVRQPESVRITTRDIGTLLANSDGDDQAEILHQWLEAIDRWPYEAARQGRTASSWPMQCRAIAECLPDERCRGIAIMLEDLVTHLNCVPQERRIQATNDKVCDAIADLF